ncbi:opaque-specific ABC transporter CDR3 [Nannizzia gypsea CBS 118893]|uniref:Opaque-specific ABC transporter CDR3 n=1 Tax=Arthroderma gypseum (strain ATCC MYA-4604 / CBS 118893) TaxID=535722 RepID=E4V6E1_ARTGP|nr:opaque-specific ABC transporter CDR3 [Nannizzia gypsea CBS 118893]EFQ96657.1 opaque-specific ABC transporter CDR3 [Nannizzia gypsea CBS 118893]
MNGTSPSSTCLGDAPGDNVGLEAFGERLNEDITKVASRASISSTSAQTLAQSRALNPAPGSNFDPSSAAFDARAWIQDFVRVCESDPKSAPSRALGVAFRRLNVFGWGTGAEYQRTTGSVVSDTVKWLARFATGYQNGQRVDILRDFEGIIEKGEMLLVLGPPGSGCSTLLKALSGETHDLSIEPDSHSDFRGVGLDHIRSSLRGDVLYNAELDTHLAPLTVNETLTFASRARSPRHIPGGVSRIQLDTIRRDVIMAVFGLTHTYNTRVGDNVVRGVSGGERKRVSIAEATLTGAKFQYWDNSTRGLDSNNAINFCRHLRSQADLLDVTSVVTLYQAPQAAYDLFNRVTVIYEGRQIYFGSTIDAKAYFEELGFCCPERQTIPDFLTSMTSADERKTKQGFEHCVPRTASEFAARWQASKERQALLRELDEYPDKHPQAHRLQEYLCARRTEQAKFQRPSSAYTISYMQQVSLTLWRAYRRLLANPSYTISFLVFNAVIAIVLGSMYLRLKEDTSSFYYRAGVIFFSLLFNAFGSQLEIAHINPLAYGFESLMANEFHNRRFPCTSFVPHGPGYEDLPSVSRICSVVSSEAGSAFVNGDSYINMSFNYWNSHKWRNIGIMLAFLAFFIPAYILAAELSKPPKAKGEVLVFQRAKRKALTTMDKKISVDPENQLPDRPVITEKYGTTNEPAGVIGKGTNIFHWEDLCYDINIKNEERRLLDHIDGWVKPGVSTALMGVSGARKTTLLNILAARVTVGVVSGDTMINGKLTDTSFQHKVGYIQQQDLHLSTSTIREALQFSALLRQPSSISEAEKLQYADEVIDILEIRDVADAIIGVPGEGLNIKQRKRLTIGVELAARPQLLIFFDEPTSGLDSQTSWAISELIKKLTNSGQAVLCTVHQPSTILFNQFDRLFLIAPGGKTVYFGDLGQDSSTLIEYFERNHSSPCPSGANPAEWMLQVIQPPADGTKRLDWHQIWLESPEYTTVKSELHRLRSLPIGGIHQENEIEITARKDPSMHQEFVAPFWTQFLLVLRRTFNHYWRSPLYIWSKTILIALSTIYLGFSFSADNTIQGMTNQLWAIFMLFIPFININEQIMPMVLPQRALFEARERPSKIYRWTTFILSNIIVELFWNTLMAVLMYVCWYYPIGFTKNTMEGDQAIRGFLVFLLLWTYMLFTSTIAHFAITWIDMPDTAGILTSFMWLLCIFFCGIGVRKQDIPRFWIFMYRLSPATYLVGGLMSSAVANSEVHCASHEILTMRPIDSSTCGDFLNSYINSAGGMVLNPSATDICRYCPIASSNEFLAGFHISYNTRWRDFGLMWVYILFNIAGALGHYWVFRVPKK